MGTGRSQLDAAFVERQRQYLMRLRASLQQAVQSSESEEAAVEADSADGAREYEDEAQKLAALELDGNLVARDAARLERVERALKKIAEGTYGLSDVSGQPIAQQRLEALPEALCTLSEEQAAERGR